VATCDTPRNVNSSKYVSKLSELAWRMAL
jgi:hypothetical protein